MKRKNADEGEVYHRPAASTKYAVDGATATILLLEWFARSTVIRKGGRINPAAKPMEGGCFFRLRRYNIAALSVLTHSQPP